MIRKSGSRFFRKDHAQSMSSAFAMAEGSLNDLQIVP
jgi:hypothetical protein